MAITTLAERGELSRAARSFLRTEAGSAVLLLGAAVLALLWANLAGGYEEFWHTELHADPRRHGVRRWTCGTGSTTG